jgi:AAA family ATP:ADP antiporter
MKNFLNKLLLPFTKESSLAGIFFFFVLSSWYVLRPVRNEMAVSNVENLPLLLAVGALAMLLVNPIYSRLASKTNLRKLLIYCYSFFILNLLGFLFAWKVLDLDGVVWLGRAFYIWCNIYSFFVVSIFWVVIINVFRTSKTRNFYGVIMAGGSIGALVGSEISKRFANSFTDSGLEFF